MNLLKTRRLVYLAFFVALSIVLSRFLSINVPFGGVAGIRIGFGGLPIIFSGMAFGPLAGAAVGAISDLLGYIINPQGAYMPHFTISAALTGVIPAVIFIYLFKRKINVFSFLVAIAIGQFTTTVLMVSYFLYSLFGLHFPTIFMGNLISQGFTVPVYVLMMLLLTKSKTLRVGELSPIKA